MRTYYMLTFIILIFLAMPPRCRSQEEKPSSPQKLSDETQACIECHKSVTPGIVEDWMTSHHAKISPEAGLAKPYRASCFK